MGKKLSLTHPHIAGEWDYEKNAPLTPDDVTPGSGRRVWWVCGEGHEFESTIVNRTRKNRPCPVCSGSTIVHGVNDVLTIHPALQKFWKPHTPNDHDIHCLGSGSHKTITWECDHGHTWERPVYKAALAEDPSCPVCSDRVLIPGVNDLATLHPGIAAEWHPDNPMLPSEVKPYSSRRVQWRCAQGHEWATTPNSRVRGNHGCPYCAGYYSTKSGSLLAQFPAVAGEWSKDGNGYIAADSVSPHSHYEAWWKCSRCGHEWRAAVYHRTRENGSGCPCCSGRIPLRGRNDLSTTHPEESKYYHENNIIPVTDISAGSGREVLWKCDRGHEWIMPPVQALSPRRRSLCPQCSPHGVSAQEDRIYEFIRGVLPDDVDVVRNSRSVIPPQELDIYIPKKNLAVEYNGIYWHSEERGKDKNYHYNKWRLCRDLGIQLITIWEDEWQDKRGIVESMLQHKMKTSTGERIYARKCVVDRISHGDSLLFLNSNHIQGGARGSIHLGLFTSSGDLVAVSVWQRRSAVLYLERYATSGIVVGGMGKMLSVSRCMGREMGCSRIVTFADHCVSDGGLYESLGFAAEAELPPDYSYVVDGARKHKFGYRVERFKRDPLLRYEEGLSERDLARLNGLPRLYDCGKTRYVLDI